MWNKINFHFSVAHESENFSLKIGKKNINFPHAHIFTDFAAVSKKLFFVLHNLYLLSVFVCVALVALNLFV